MTFNLSKTTLVSTLSLCCLLLFVILVNYPLISFDMMYPEQPIIYLINQKITHFSDLINVYMHPQLLHSAIPFFRPSGHFLTYQLIMPLLGWHNTKGLIIVSLIFLALTGYYLIKLYNLLFPRFKVGGYIAFSFYMMHPALSLSRLTIMHFEFAYVFFVTMSMYYFVLFCQKNANTTHDIKKINFQYFSLLAYSLLFYAIANTFKEPSLMLGPVLISYFLITFYYRQPLSNFLYSVMQNKQAMKILMLIMTVNILFIIYLTLPWPTFSHPIRNKVATGWTLLAVKEFFKIIFCINQESISQVANVTNDTIWRGTIYPTVTRFIIWMSLSVTLLSSILVFSKKSDEKKSLLFLYLASFIFLILPIAWAMGLPWHLSLTILFLSMVIGFSFEYLLHSIFKKQKSVNVIGGVTAILIGLTTIIVNQQNIQRYELIPESAFNIKLARNAVLYPPQIQNKLHSDSVIVVADSSVHNSYAFGSSYYPYLLDYLLGNFNLDAMNVSQRWYFLKHQPIYNGTLFRWAYLMPNLQEEVYQFRVKKMKDVPSEILYNWLQNYKNIFCLGYDKNANWYDQTPRFKANLLNESRRRNLVVNQYVTLSATQLKGKMIYAKTLPVPDAKLCQYTCDQDEQCSAVNYIDVQLHDRKLMQCNFYSGKVERNEKSCDFCTGFIKELS